MVVSTERAEWVDLFIGFFIRIHDAVNLRNPVPHPDMLVQAFLTDVGVGTLITFKVDRRSFYRFI